MDQRRPVAVEYREHCIENVAHHLLAVICRLHDPINPIHGLEEPQVGQALLLRPLALGDVAQDSDRVDLIVQLIGRNRYRHVKDRAIPFDPARFIERWGGLAL